MSPILFSLFLLWADFAQGGELPERVRPYSVDRVAPEYPAEAQQARIEGSLLAELRVGRAGAVESVRIVEAKPEQVFDSAVIDAALKWRFIPACGTAFPDAFAIRQPFGFRIRPCDDAVHCPPYVNLAPPVYSAPPAAKLVRSGGGLRIARPDSGRGCRESGSPPAPGGRSSSGPIGD
jgi:TonB family protein